MKKIILFSFLIISIYSVSFAQTNRYTSVPMPLSLANPLSFNGTYEVDRLIIRNGDDTLLDSENVYDVYDDKGVATINMKISQNSVAVELIYKMQMVGPAFKRPEISKYSFLYDNQVFTANRPKNMPLSKALSQIGMTIYDHEDLIWEMPFEKGYTLIMKLEKKTDISTIINKKPFIITED